MSRAPQTFKKRDLTAALQSAASAGLKVVRVEIGKDGRIILVTSGEPCSSGKNANEWDSVLGDKD